MTKVLIVDDSRFDRHMIRRALSETDNTAEFTELASGEDTVATIEAERPCVTVLDIRMPGMDGFAVLRAIRQNAQTSDHKVVMMSGSDRGVDRTLAKTHQADGYYVKPETAHAYQQIARDIAAAHIPCSRSYRGIE